MSPDRSGPDSTRSREDNPQRLDSAAAQRQSGSEAFQLAALFDQASPLARSPDIQGRLEKIYAIGPAAALFAHESLLVFRSAELLEGHAEVLLDGIAAVLANSRDWRVRSELTLRVLTEVKESNPGRLMEGLSAMAAYDGSVPILRAFLAHAGSYDPFVATNRMQLSVLRAADLPREAVVYEGSSDSPRVAAVRGGSGALLSAEGNVYVIYDPARPLAVFAVKRQAALSIFRNWRPAEFSEEPLQQRRRQRRQAQGAAAASTLTGQTGSVSAREFVGEEAYAAEGLEQLEGVNVAQLESNADFRRLAKRNPILARELAVYREMKLYIELMKGESHRLLRGESLLRVDRTVRKIELDPGGQLLGWTKRMIEEEDQADAEGRAPAKRVPANVRLAHAKISDPYLVLSAAEERHLLEGLIAWQSLESRISKEVAFGGVASDIVLHRDLSERAESLATGHPVNRQRYSFDTVLHDQDGILFRRDGEVSYEEAVRVIEGLGIKNWRAAMNRYLFAQYAREFHQGIERLRFMFQEQQPGGSRWLWRSDSSENSVPLKRLRNDCILARPLVPAGGRKQGVLLQKDFECIMDSLTLLECARDESVFFTALPIKRFEALVRGVVLASRKAEALYIKLAEDGIQFPAGHSRDNIGEFLDHWNPRIPTGGYSQGSRLWLSEELELPTELEKRPRDRLGEIVARAESGLLRGEPLAEWHRIREQLLPYARVAICPETLREPVISTAAHVSSFSPIGSEIQSKIELAEEVAAHPLIDLPLPWRDAVAEASRQLKRGDTPERRWYERGFVSPVTERVLDRISSFRSQYLVIKEFGEVSELAREAGRLRKSLFYEVERSGRNLIVRERWLSDLDFGLELKDEISFYSPHKVDEIVKSLKARFMPVEELFSPEQAGRLSALRTRASLAGDTPRGLDALRRHDALIERLILE